MYIRNIITLVLLGVSSVAFSIDGAPRDTVSIPFEVIKMDQEILGGVEVGVRLVGTGRQYIVKFTVAGFSLDLEATTGTGNFQHANEVSYYSPEWQSSTNATPPSFVWWDSDEKTSSHILKFKPVEYVGQPHYLGIRYSAENGAKAELQIKVH